MRRNYIMVNREVAEKNSLHFMRDKEGAVAYDVKNFLFSFAIYFYRCT